jgi:hypothetical protein
MPKNRKAIKTSQAIVMVNTPNKFRIGTRKAGKSAHTMSNKELKAILKNVDMKNSYSNAVAVLKLRGLNED